jgi:hypothetical protein
MMRIVCDEISNEGGRIRLESLDGTPEASDSATSVCRARVSGSESGRAGSADFVGIVPPSGAAGPAISGPPENSSGDIFCSCPETLRLSGSRNDLIDTEHVTLGNLLRYLPRMLGFSGWFTDRGIDEV